MNIPFTGGCVCGEVRYECDSLPLKMFNCHCRDCQRVGGGSYAPIIVVPLMSAKFARGAIQRYATTRMNGRPNVRGFCAKCGSRLTVGEDVERNILGLLASSLDDPAWFKPAMDIFVCDSQPWDMVDAHLPKHQQYMPRG